MPEGSRNFNEWESNLGNFIKNIKTYRTLKDIRKVYI